MGNNPLDGSIRRCAKRSTQLGGIEPATQPLLLAELHGTASVGGRESFQAVSHRRNLGRGTLAVSKLIVVRGIELHRAHRLAWPIGSTGFSRA